MIMVGYIDVWEFHNSTYNLIGFLKLYIYIYAFYDDPLFDLLSFWF